LIGFGNQKKNIDDKISLKEKLSYHIIKLVKIICKDEVYLSSKSHAAIVAGKKNNMKTEEESFIRYASGFKLRKRWK
jgi:hypothetical protein